MNAPSLHFIPQPVEVDISYSRRSGPHSPWEPVPYPSGHSTEPDLDLQGGGTYRSSQASYVEFGRVNSQNPMVNFCNTMDGPFIPKGTIPDPGSCGPPYQKNLGTSFHARDTSLRMGHFRQEFQTEEQHVPYAVAPSDSGYETRRSLPTASLRSVDINRDSSLEDHVSIRTPKSRPFTGGRHIQDFSRDDSYTKTVSKPISPAPFICDHCKTPVKTRSELKYDLPHFQPTHLS